VNPDKTIKTNREGLSAATETNKGWEYDEDMNGGGEPLGTFTIYDPYSLAPGSTTEDPEPYVVATVYARTDARMIREAPAMLDALVWLVRLAESQSLTDREAVRNARVIIAKLEGKT
jgi:hypothetical protein